MAPQICHSLYLAIYYYSLFPGALINFSYFTYLHLWLVYIKNWFPGGIYCGILLFLLLVIPQQPVPPTVSFNLDHNWGSRTLDVKWHSHMGLPVHEQKGPAWQRVLSLRSQDPRLYFCQPHPATDLVNKKLKFFFFSFLLSTLLPLALRFVIGCP